MVDQTRLAGWRQDFGRLPTALRWSTYTIVVLVVALVLGLATGVAVVRRSFPDYGGSLEISGLQGEVDVLRDEHGIPQIYADSTHDLMLAQGFVQAQERFFEMDVRRHATAGRLAELFGEDAVETDTYVRTMDWRGIAERELALAQPETRAALEAFSDGVNAYLLDRSPSRISLEYAVLNAGGLDYRPAAWTPVDSIAWLKAMAWDLRGNMADEIDRVLVASRVGETRMRQLYPDYPFAQHPPIVTQGAVVDNAFEPDASGPGTRNPRRVAPFGAAGLRRLAEVGRGLRRMPSWLGAGDGIGSNGWVVAADRSETGAPLLANDPHLGVSLPGVWMQMGLHCRELTAQCPYDVAGFTFAGVPGVILGHNRDIAWGFTNLGADVSDLYVERVRGDRWLSGTTWRPLTARRETIKVADGDDVEITVRTTAHGPILSDVDDVIAEVGDEAEVPRTDTSAEEEYAVSLSWTGLQPRPTIDAVLGLGRATDWRSFRGALADFAAPAQNVVYADTAGHIGYQATGVVPIRKSGNTGYLPSAGWLRENDWTGEFVPTAALPNVLDPRDGFVASANQAVVGTDYPYDLTTDWDQGYRASRIRDRLTELTADGATASPGELLALQRDTDNPLGPILTPALLEIGFQGRYQHEAQALLDDWDYSQPADSAAAAYFNVVWRNLLALTFRDELPEDAWPQGGARWIAVVDDLLDHPDDPWWDDVTTDETEQRDDILRAAMVKARDDLTVLISPEVADWTWGAIHRLELRSSTLGESGIGVVERLFNRGGWEVGGGGSIVDATSWDATEGFEVTSAPSMRMVLNLDDFDTARWINLTGVSGHAFADHYTDQTDLWARGETLPWVFGTEAVEAAATDRQRLQPTGD